MYDFGQNFANNVLSMEDILRKNRTQADNGVYDDYIKMMQLKQLNPDETEYDITKIKLNPKRIQNLKNAIRYFQ